MGDAIEGRDGRPRPGILTVIMAVTGLIVGAATGLGEGKLLKAADRLHLSWSDQGALLIAMTFLASGAITVVLATNRRGLAILANPGAPDFKRPPASGQAVYFWLQGGVLILAGAMLAAPIGFEIDRGPGQAAGAPVWMAVVLAAFVLQSAMNIRIWVTSDEVQRKVISESGAACFWMLQGLYFLWACGEKLAVLPRITSWDAVTVMMGCYVITSMIMVYRRGLA